MEPPTKKKHNVIHNYLWDEKVDITRKEIFKTMSFASSMSASALAKSTGTIHIFLTKHPNGPTTKYAICGSSMLITGYINSR